MRHGYGSSTRLARVAAGALLLLAACTEREPERPAPPVLRIGLLLHMSGERPTGPIMQKGAELLVRSVNAQGGLPVGGKFYQVALVVEETHNTEAGAASAARTLLARNDLVALIGPQVSSQAIRVAPLAEDAGIPLISPGATNPLVTRGKRFVFRVAPTDSLQAEGMSRFAVELGRPRAAVLYDVANPYNRTLGETFRAAYQRRGGQVVAAETFTTDAATDFRPQMRRIIAAGAELLVLPNYMSEAALQMRQARELGYRGLFMGCDAWDAATLARDLPEADGSYYTHTWEPAGMLEPTQGFVRDFQAAYGYRPDVAAAATYDALRLIFQAIQNEGSTTPEAIREGLTSIAGFPGVTGTITYAGSGDPQKTIVVSRMRGGSLELSRRLEPEPPSR